MKYFASYTFPILPDELLEISKMIEEREVFTVGFNEKETDPYNPMNYHAQRDIHNTRTIMVVDRNLFSHWINIDKFPKKNQEQRIAAATLAFCQCCDILIEPSIALYEVAASSDSQTANEEEAIFRIADNTTPRFWTDIALQSDENNILLNKKVATKEAIDFEMSLRIWNRCYILALKVASLSLQVKDHFTRVEKLINWMFSDFMFLGPGTILALLYFAPNSPKKGIFKKLYSKDRAEAISGIKNAAWDLTLIYEWYLKVKQKKEKNQLTVLGSLDKKLHLIAKNILDFDKSESTNPNSLEKIVSNFWEKSDAKKIQELLMNYYEDIESPSRNINKAQNKLFIDDFIQIGEEAILNWTSNL